MANQDQQQAPVQRATEAQDSAQTSLNVRVQFEAECKEEQNPEDLEQNPWKQNFLPKCKGLALLPIGDRKIPVDPATGGGLKGWPSRSYSIEELSEPSEFVHGLSYRPGPDSGWTISVDLDGDSASGWFRERDAEPNNAGWRTTRAADRQKVHYRLTDAQIRALEEACGDGGLRGKCVVTTKEAAQGGKAEQIELFISSGQCAIAGQPREGPPYQNHGSPQTVTAPDRATMAALIDLVKTALKAAPRAGVSRKPGQRWQSGRDYPCPICGRDTTSACTIWLTEEEEPRLGVNCHHGQSFHPPTEFYLPGLADRKPLEKSDVVPGADGALWAFSGQGLNPEIGTFSKFLQHRPMQAKTSKEKDSTDVTATVPMPPGQYMAELRRIKNVEKNPAVMYMEMERFAASQGDYRKTGPQLEKALIEYDYFEDCSQRNRKLEWWQGVDSMKFIVPGLMLKPTSILLHAAGGVGKTQTAMALAKSVGKGNRMMVRGIEVEVEKGNVLWIQNDQSLSKLIQDCENQGIDVQRDTWFIVKRGFQLNHTHQLSEWVREYKPVLVIVDSVTSCSTKMQVEEKDSAFAAPFYHYSEKNGDLGPEGFPATTIIWIHHDNAAGDARGNRLLVAGIDEQWHLRKPNETEHGPLQGQGHKPAQCRMVQIKKSRLGREGDLLVVERDANYEYSVADFTPTQRHEDSGNGDPEADTMMLQIVKDHALEARERGKDDGMTVREVWESLSHLMFGQGREAPAQRTVERWLKRWQREGLLVAGAMKKTPCARKPSRTFTIPKGHTPPTRGGTDQDSRLSIIPSKPLQERGSNKRQAGEADERVIYSECTHSTTHGITDTLMDARGVSVNQIPVADCDLKEETTNESEVEFTRVCEELSPCNTPSEVYEAPFSSEDFGDWENDW